MSVLESGAYTATTRLDPKRIAVHLSSCRHDLSMVQNWFETNNVAKPDLLPKDTCPSNVKLGTAQDIESWMENMVRVPAMRTSPSNFSAITEMSDWR